MFNKKVLNNFPSKNIIGLSTVVTGEIISVGDFRVDGEFNGVVDIKGEFIVGPSGIVSGEIKAKTGEVSGKVCGTMVFEESVVLKSTAEIDGDIITNKLIIEDGCTYNGRCTMKINETE
jgi:cytoskeletal protein CcmA (bactofilin family)